MAAGAKACVFCAIVRGETPAAVVFEDDLAVAFLDHRPLLQGHCLLVPKQHVETLPDLPAELAGPLFQRAQLLCQAVERGMAAHGSFLAVNNRISQSVPHLHTHVVPRNPKDGLRGFFWPRTRYSDEAEAAAVAERLRAAVASGSGV